MEKKEISTLFRQYYGRMYGMAVSILYDEQESKDVVSDIFERLLESDTVLLPDTVEHYLLTSVRNSCLKRISQKRTGSVSLCFMPANNRWLHLQKKMNSGWSRYCILPRPISPQQQCIFKMRFLGGMKYGEIGEELGISRVAVWKHLSNITKMIKEQFKDSEL